MSINAEVKSPKSVSKSVSMPDWLWDLVEAHAPTTPGKDRSGYFRNLVEDNLRAVGKLANEGAQDVEFLAKIAATVKIDANAKKAIERVLMKSREALASANA